MIRPKEDFDLIKNLSISQQGLSILEVLVASTIMAFLGLGIVTITDNSFQTKDRVINEDEDFLAVELGLSRIEKDLTQIYTPLFFSKKYVAKNTDQDQLDVNPYAAKNERFPVKTEQGYLAPLFSAPDKSTFEFFTASNRRKIQDARQSQFAWVHYTLESASLHNDDLSDSEKDLSYLVRYYFPFDPFGKELLDLEKNRGHVLLKNIKSLEFTYWNPKNKKFVSSLKEVEEEDKTLGTEIVRGVKLKFTWVDKNGIESEEQRIYRSFWPYFKEKDENEDNKNKTNNSNFSNQP